MTTEAGNQGVMQIRVTLNDSQPAIWRRILVPTSIRYDQLHAVIQVIFDWNNSHLYNFLTAGHHEYVSADLDDDAEPNELVDMNFPYKDLVEGPITYTYDFGDSWEHNIELEQIVPMADLTAHQIPFCLSGEGANVLENTRGLTPKEVTADMQATILNGRPAKEAGHLGIAGSDFNQTTVNDLLAEFFVDSWTERLR
ncbi:plasmid pRiA4b ORF-3 family protein [Levilactobacillus bambusae]|nr:plasmid pRiA4b ORF-3 family protein [Levilactobacillus bambusae]